MAVDTFMAYVGVYSSVADAEADYELVKEAMRRAQSVESKELEADTADIARDADAAAQEGGASPG